MIQYGGVSGGAARAKCFPAGWNAVAKPCDYCKSAAALIFCTTESAFMCMTCDVKVHNDVISSRHERVWKCEVCELSEQAPASCSCKAGVAALCVVCDRNIHSANPLARRHERTPIVPFYDTAESMKSASVAATYLLPVKHLSCAETKMENATDNWISSNPVTSKLSEDMKFMELLISNSDQFLNFECPIFADSVVPVQTVKPAVPTKLTEYSSENPFEIDFNKSNINSHNNSYTITTPSFSVSSSSLDVGVVPDGSTLSDISFPFTLNMSIRGNEASHMMGMDREARVLRYKEKRKKRKFDKTIRYASRKAYAETRPRINGRFAKRTEVQSDTDRLSTFNSFSANLIADDARFGAVPSF